MLREAKAELHGLSVIGDAPTPAAPSACSAGTRDATVDGTGASRRARRAGSSTGGSAPTTGGTCPRARPRCASSSSTACRWWRPRCACPAATRCSASTARRPATSARWRWSRSTTSRPRPFVVALVVRGASGVELDGRHGARRRAQRAPHEPPAVALGGGGRRLHRGDGHERRGVRRPVRRTGRTVAPGSSARSCTRSRTGRRCGRW